MFTLCYVDDVSFSAVNAALVIFVLLEVQEAMKVGCRFAMTEPGAQYVMIFGARAMQELCAGSSAMLLVVKMTAPCTFCITLLQNVPVVAGATAFNSAFFGQGTGNIFMDDVACSGSESQLQSCSHNRYHNCGHGEDASVRCSSTRDTPSNGYV